jgi:RNA polymerase sigma factor (TIGR02999 family)
METSDGTRGDVTRLLEAAVAGDSQALDRLVPLVYEDLRRVAHRQLDREGGGHTLQTTALIHEAYLKLAAGGAMSATSRAHFLAIAARAMRQVLVDYARRRKATKRGGGVISVTLGDQAGPADTSADSSAVWRKRTSQRYSACRSEPSAATGSRPVPGCSRRCTRSRKSDQFRGGPMSTAISRQRP